MPNLTIVDVGTFDVPLNKRLVLALEDEAGLDQLHACGGRARCTTCRVEFVSGEPPAHTKAELAALGAKQLTGVRLSCQILVDHTMTVRAISRLAGSGRPDAGGRPQPFIEPPPDTERPASLGATTVIDPAFLVRAYREGVFPMALEDGEIGWFSPDPRGVLPLDAFHMPARLGRVMRRGTFTLRFDVDFEAVMRACAERPDEGTWISEEILESYVALHRLGLAHSVEAWAGGQLAGGLYGVHLGGAFFGESMFHRVTDASKVALVALVDRLTRRGFSLVDIQWVTPHLEQFGAIAIPRPEYLRRLAAALAHPREF